MIPLNQILRAPGVEGSERPGDRDPLDINQDGPADDADRIAPEIAADGPAQAPPARDAEPGGVDRAFDDLAVEASIRQQNPGVRTGILNGIDAAGDIIDSDRPSLDDPPDHSVLGNRHNRGDLGPPLE